MLVKIYLYTIMLSVFSGSLNNSTNTRITVIGTALNAKGGAVVQTDKGIYFLHGLDEWDERYYSKKVKVTGKLRIEKHERQSTDSRHVQEWVGTRNILKKPKWNLVE